MAPLPRRGCVGFTLSNLSAVSFLKTLIAMSPSPTDEDLEAWRQAAIAQFNASSYDIPTSRTVALLAIEWCRKRDLSAIAPVPVSEQPWQRDGWCDPAGRCWFHSAGREFGDWYLLPVASITSVETHCLPHWSIPLPQSTAPEIQP